MRKWVIRGISFVLVLCLFLGLIWGYVLRSGYHHLEQEVAYWHDRGVDVPLYDEIVFNRSETGTPQILQVVSLYNALPESLAEAVNDAESADPHDLEHAISVSEETLRQIHRIADQEQGVWREGVATTPLWMDDLLSRIGHPRSVIRLLDAEILVRHRSGDIQGAGESIAAGLSLSRQIGEPPSFIAMLMQAIYEDMMLAHIESVYAEGGLPPQEAIDSIREIDLPSKIPAILSWELVINSRLTGGIGKPLSVHNVAYSLSQCRRLTEQIEQEGMQLCEIKADIDHPWWAVSFPMGAPQLDSLISAALQYQARVDLAETAIRLRQYKADHGAYPKSLEALGDVPDDPCNGYPITYHRIGDGFELISTCSNRMGDPLDWRWTK